MDLNVELAATDAYDAAAGGEGHRRLDLKDEVVLCPQAEAQLWRLRDRVTRLN